MDWHNYVFVLKRVKNDGRYLFYSSNELKNNYNIVSEAIKKNVHSFVYASDKLKNNYELIHLSIKISKEKNKIQKIIKYIPIIPKELSDKYKSIDKIYSIFEIYVNKGNNLKIYKNDFDLLINFN